MIQIMIGSIIYPKFLPCVCIGDFHTPDDGSLLKSCWKTHHKIRLNVYIPSRSHRGGYSDRGGL